MTTTKAIEYLTIKGFKSIKQLERFPLRELNVLIGANGSGKSNFISYFQMLSELVDERLQSWVAKQGGADRVLSFGVKETNYLESAVSTKLGLYDYSLEITIDSKLVFKKEKFSWTDPKVQATHTLSATSNEPKSPVPLSGYSETILAKSRLSHINGMFFKDNFSDWTVYHFHDTSDTAGVKRLGSLHDNEYLRQDASNLAAFLYRLKLEYPDVYQQIRKTVSLAIPFFDDFVLKPNKLPTEEEQIRLLWRQKDSDYALWPSQLSDGSIRFICLVTALLQPEAPSTIIIDEPELGLHPYAITLLGSLLRSASKRMQVIVSTQSVPLVNEFSLEDLIIVEREKGASIFKRLDADEFDLWLEEYSTGELWEKNILGGRPQP